MQIKDRPEFKSKGAPLTFGPADMVADAVKEMADRGYGSVVIVDADRKPIGLVTERDIMNRLVRHNLPAESTPLEAIMTRDVRVASAEDDILDWLRIMSNERFRRLPIVDSDGRVTAIMTQGDFVSYTWPDLIHQAAQLGKATLSRNYQILLVAGGIGIYVLIALVLLVSVGVM